ncbi:hypothetical protein EDD22DRAFT_911544 [Suillus occidentalis]|nr:hypothetical protein EDD22DRAFT_911544 [Suillus occidentalis]
MLLEHKYIQHWYTTLSHSAHGYDKSRPASLEPWHDVLPKNAFSCLCYKALCMIAVSKSSVEHLRHLTEPHKEMVVNRFENMNVTVMITSAVFISTNPPSPLMPYASHAALISLMTGTSVLIVYDTCYANNRILKSLMQSRSRRICCLILMAYPSLALAASTLALKTAFFIAGFTSDKLFVKIMTAGAYLTLIFLAVLAIYELNRALSCATSDVSDSNDDPPSAEPKLSVIVGFFTGNRSIWVAMCRRATLGRGLCQ